MFVFTFLGFCAVLYQFGYFESYFCRVFFSSSRQLFNWLPTELFQLTGTHSIICLLNFCAVKVQSLEFRLCFSMMNTSGGALTSPAQSMFAF